MLRSFQLFLLVFALAYATYAQAPQTTVKKPTEHTPVTSENPAPTVPAAVAHKLEPGDLEAFFDGIIPIQLERSDIAGATVLVMKDGQVLLEKGYGYSDLAKKSPVEPKTTMFRLASISKLFTWISVMQLAEQGKLDIDTDVNRYLDFKIAPAFGKPITLRNLMTHTGGFEEEIRDLLVTDPKLSPPLREFLVENQPRRIYPPGEISAYSNYGVGLAGYIVQRISGERYEDYVRQHIFEPLGMTHSSFRQPLPDAFQKNISQGYNTTTEKPPIGFEVIQPDPAGGVSSSAADMGRFAQALLNGGELDGQRILKPETLKAMWTRQYATSDQMPAMCMGFYQTWRNGLHFIGHEGDLVAFHSMFFLEPEQKLVLFVSYNSAHSSSKARDELLRGFVDRYYSYTPHPKFQKVSASDLKAMAGTYESTRRSESTKMKLLDLFDYVHATADTKDGVLHLDDYKNLRGHVQNWKPIGNGLWQEDDGQDLLYPVRDAHGVVRRLAFDFPGQQLQRVPWYENDVLIFPLLAASLAVLAAVVLASLFRLGRRLLFRRRPALEPQPGTMRITPMPRLAAFAWVITVAYLITIILVMTTTTSMPPSHLEDKYFVLCNVLTAIAILFSIFAVISVARVLPKIELRAISRVKFALVGLACVFLTWFAIHWNVIGSAHRF